MSKTLLSSKIHNLVLLSPLGSVTSSRKAFFFFLTTFCSLTSFSCLRVWMPLIGLFQLKKVTTTLICITVPNDEVDTPIYQNLCCCQLDEQHTFTRSAKKTSLSRKFSCLKEQKQETSHILYILATASRLLTTVKYECSAHSWWTLGYASFCTEHCGSATWDYFRETVINGSVGTSIFLWLKVSCLPMAAE